jgi:hypothetical protein
MFLVLPSKGIYEILEDNFSQFFASLVIWLKIFMLHFYFVRNKKTFNQ